VGGRLFFSPALISMGKKSSSPQKKKGFHRRISQTAAPPNSSTFGRSLVSITMAGLRQRIQFTSVWSKEFFKGCTMKDSFINKRTAGFIASDKSNFSPTKSVRER
jgi:hypothetical protein